MNEVASAAGRELLQQTPVVRRGAFTLVSTRGGHVRSCLLCMAGSIVFFFRTGPTQTRKQ